MILKLYAHIDSEQVWRKGREAGLSDTAINQLRHFNEIPLLVAVDAENGAVVSCEIDPLFKESLG